MASLAISLPCSPVVFSALYLIGDHGQHFQRDRATYHKHQKSGVYVEMAVIYIINSVLTQSNEIKAAVPQVVKAAEEAGYPIDKMTVAGGSAGHALAMIYAPKMAVLGPWCHKRPPWGQGSGPPTLRRQWASFSPDRSRLPLLRG